MPAGLWNVAHGFPSWPLRGWQHRGPACCHPQRDARIALASRLLYQGLLQSCTTPSAGAGLRPDFLPPPPARAVPHPRGQHASAKPAASRPLPSALPPPRASAKDAPQARPKQGSGRGEGFVSRPRRGSRMALAPGSPPPPPQQLLQQQQQQQQQRSKGAGDDEAEAAELRRQQGWNALLHAQGEAAPKGDAQLALQGGMDGAPGQPGLHGPPDFKRLSNSQWEEWALQVIRQKKKTQQQAQQRQRQDEQAAVARSSSVPPGRAGATSARQGLSGGRSAAGRASPARAQKAKAKANGEGPLGGTVIAQKSIVATEKASLGAAGPRALGQSLKGPSPRAECRAVLPSATQMKGVKTLEDAARFKSEHASREDAGLLQQDSAHGTRAESGAVDVMRPMLPAAALDRLLSDPRLAPKDVEASRFPENIQSLDTSRGERQSAWPMLQEGSAQSALAPGVRDPRPSSGGTTSRGATVVGAVTLDCATAEKRGALRGPAGAATTPVLSAWELPRDQQRGHECSGAEDEAGLGWTPSTANDEDTAGPQRGGDGAEDALDPDLLAEEEGDGHGTAAGFSAVLEKAIGGRRQAALDRPAPLGFGIPLMPRRSASPGARGKWEQAVAAREGASIGAVGRRGRGDALLTDKESVVASKEEPVLKLLQEHGMTDADLSRFMERRRAPVTTRVELLRERLSFMQTELGLNAVQLSRLIALHPRVLSHPVHSCLRPHLEFLLSLGLSPVQLPRILRLAPKIFDLSIERSLQPRIAFLLDAVGVAPEQLASVICRSPQVLTQSLKGGHLPRLHYFCHDLSIPRAQFARMVTRHPQLLHYSLSQGVKPRVGLMRSWGLSTNDVALVLQRCPQVLSLSIENALVPKFEYLVRRLGGSAASVVSFPAFFSLSLDGRIKPRYLYFLFMRQSQAEPSPSPPRAGPLHLEPVVHVGPGAATGAQDGAEGRARFPLCWMALKDEDFCARLGQMGIGQYHAFLADLASSGQ